jgi:ankyrin repeat protein
VKEEQESHDFMVHLLPFIESNKLDKGIILHQCVKMCDSGTFFQFLLGTFKDENGAYLDNRKPRVDINAQDNQGMTALHYALVP